MIKKIVLLLTLGIMIGWIASCAWRAPLQEINVPISLPNSNFQSE